MTSKENLRVLRIIPIVIAFVVGVSAVLAAAFEVIESGRSWSLSGYFAFFKIFAVIMGTFGFYVIVRDAAQYPKSWLGQLATLINKLALATLAILGLVLLGQLYEERLRLFLFVVVLIVYVAVFYFSSPDKDDSNPY